MGKVSGRIAEYNYDEFVEKIRPVERLGKIDSSWWLYQQAAEIAAGVEDPPPLAVEIGTWVGGTAIPMALAGMTVVCVDTFRATDDFSRESLKGRKETLTDFLDNVQSFELEEKIIAVVARSEFASQLLWSIAPNMIFIDGDHSREGVQLDLDRWAPKLVFDGLLCGHDYGAVHYMADVVGSWAGKNGWPPPQEGPDGLWFMRRRGV